MDTTKLVEALDKAIATDRFPEEKLFLQLLKQVWQVDWTVAPYDVLTHMIEWDIPYFFRFMGIDQGDEEEEEQLIQNWISSRTQLQTTTTSDEGRRRLIALINEVNHLRITGSLE